MFFIVDLDYINAFREVDVYISVCCFLIYNLSADVVNSYFAAFFEFNTDTIWCVIDWK